LSLHTSAAALKETIQLPGFCVTLLGRVKDDRVELIVIKGSAVHEILGLPSTGGRQLVVELIGMITGPSSVHLILSALLIE
jgi:hypothetical protein